MWDWRRELKLTRKLKKLGFEETYYRCFKRGEIKFDLMGIPGYVKISWRNWHIVKISYKKALNLLKECKKID